jgi:magnesium chelatase family protein
MLQRYRSRISGPLLDRIDIHIEVPAVRYRDLADRSEAESSSEISRRVEHSREVQVERFKGTKIHSNAQMTARHLRKHCELDAAGNRMLELVTDRLGLSARSFTRILKVARTIADLESDERVREQHLSGAIQYRSLDRKAS